MQAKLTRIHLLALGLLGLLSLQGNTAQADEAWRPAQGPLMTRWAKELSPQNPLPEYPRPQMVRKDWANLNGLWSYAIRPKDQARPQNWDGQILVPFAVESALSGVMKEVGPENRLWYRRTFEVPKAWNGQRVLLHFGAVDWDATVFVNGKEVGSHRGGYDPFSFDVTDALKPDAAQQEIIVSVWDPTDAGAQPRGKQVRKPEGIWYTAVTGIWQTVWLEPVAQAYIDSLKIVPDVDASSVRITASVRGAQANASVKVTVFEPADNATKAIATAEGSADREIVVKIANPRLWTPDSPTLYPISVSLADQDSVASYFGMRKVSLGKDEKGITRILLNNKFLFQYGPLDQGWWPDGLYTAPTDAALKYDIEVTKQFGFNMARKHVKVEPARWYYWCDKLGLLVWQDMPSGDKYIGPSDPDVKREKASAEQFEVEWTRIINAFHNYPSIVMWVPFNEGWGQYDTARIVDLTRKTDPTRLVNNASGWTDRRVGDVHDVHIYPGPGAPPAEEKRAIVLGEFGGLGLPLEGHTWQPKGNWGYRSFTESKSLTDAYVGLLVRLHRLIGEPGLSAAVYTQTTDVEVEVNGLLTYDRAVVKMDANRIAEAARRLYQPPPQITTLLPDARSKAQSWRYTTQQPADGWQQPGFDDSSWQTGEAGFGTKGTPGAVVRTEWRTPRIWIRRTFELPANFKLIAPYLVMHHDEDAEVYINGVLAAKVTGYTSGYEEALLTPEAKAALKPGQNVIAIHCKQTGGGQYIDAGLIDLAQEKLTAGNPVFPGWYADPEGIIFGKEYWIYPTYSAPYDEQTFFDCFSSSDLVNWTKHSRVLDTSAIKWAKRAMWAPAVVEKGGKYYFFFGANDIQNDQQLGGIGVAVADHPAGPFKDHLGKPLVDRFHNGAQPIDQFVFKDKDGQYYMIYGGWRHCNIAKLNDDFTGFVPFADGTRFKEITPEGYVEGPFMFLKDGKYYFMWSEGGWGGPYYSVAYAIADTPFGPFKRIGKILQQDPAVATGAGHHSVIHVAKDDLWYIVYHRRPLGERDANHRVTCIDRMYFDDNGLIKPIKITHDGVEKRPMQ